MPSSTKLTRALVDVAMGRKPADIVIQNGQWVCVQTGEIIPGTDIAIVEGHIAYFGEGAFHLGTRGGAAVLGRGDIGSLEIGKCAGFFAINLNRLDYAGAVYDPVSAVVFCQPMRVDYTVVGGKVIVKDGQLVTIDEGKLVEKHNKAAQRLAAG